MPPGRTITGATPGRGGSLNTVTEEFHLRSENCLGIFIAKRSEAPDGETDGDASSDDNTSVEDRSVKKKSRMRRHCHICNKQTPWVCHGCGRSLCMDPPKSKALQKIINDRMKKKSHQQSNKKKKSKPKNKGGKSGKASAGGGTKKKKTATRQKGKSNPILRETKIKASYPELFCVEVPKTVNGRDQFDRNNEPFFQKEYGEYTCYHIAHHESWKKHLYKTQQGIIEQLYQFIENSPKVKKRKR